MVQKTKKRPLSHYLKDFKYRATHCGHCGKLLGRVTLTRGDEIVNKLALARLDTLFDMPSWLVEQQHWLALCRFCGDVHCKEQNHYFNIIGFKQYLYQKTAMSPGTIREYVVRLRRLGNHLSELKVPAPSSLQILRDNSLVEWLPKTSTNNYLIALRKYWQFQMHASNTSVLSHENKSTSDIY